ncbi:hypothetical protein SeMB42_g04292 [Synchytrium endobioticum]|uniref:Ribosomal RNA-processing protein 14/surfeit locus protein 6 C-terminal domain-containing protein n=1 Tax=Synchytrium endobioticum TaxID=286115 RepID=A0A507CZD1_9FUNG|nr:hypothetical protein SeMB42_g04292 [Synchytrium endobioticum]TPX47320.1 hypothetical protein SeLEV6574_g02728 [Synchytrium endobioticum]
MGTEYSLDGLEDRLHKHRQAVEALVELIPPKWYLPTIEADEDIMPMNKKFMKNVKNQAPKQTVKETTRKAKKAKLNPENYKSAVQLEREEAANHNDEASTNNTETSVPSKPEQHGRANNVQELRQRLNARISELQSKRSISTKGEGRAALLERRLKKKEERKKAHKEVKGRTTASMDDGDRPLKDGPSSDKQSTNDVAPSLSFGKIQYGNDDNATSKKRKSDTLGLLKAAEAKKRRLEELQVKNAPKAATIMEKQAWSQLERKAEGDKLKDDPKLLKKTLKREQKRKEKSANEWEERNAQVQKSMDDRQKKRAENIAARKSGAKDKKKGGSSNKSAKKHSNKTRRPGFEGQKR